jgi:hypothetical protein
VSLTLEARLDDARSHSLHYFGEQSNALHVSFCTFLQCQWLWPVTRSILLILPTSLSDTTNAKFQTISQSIRPPTFTSYCLRAPPATDGPQLDLCLWSSLPTVYRHHQQWTDLDWTNAYGHQRFPMHALFFFSCYFCSRTTSLDSVILQSKNLMCSVASLSPYIFFSSARNLIYESTLNLVSLVFWVRYENMPCALCLD